MKTLTTVSWVTEADALCSLLDSHGIDTFLPDETTSTVNPLYGGAIGGIRIQVPDEHYPEALQITRDWMQQQGHSLNTCPQCSSDQVHYQRVSRKVAFLSLLFLGFPLLWIQKRCQCAACGHTWKPEKSPSPEI